MELMQFLTPKENDWLVKKKPVRLRCNYRSIVGYRYPQLFNLPVEGIILELGSID